MRDVHLLCAAFCLKSCLPSSVLSLLSTAYGDTSALSLYRLLCFQSLPRPGGPCCVPLMSQLVALCGMQNPFRVLWEWVIYPHSSLNKYFTGCFWKLSLCYEQQKKSGVRSAFYVQLLCLVGVQGRWDHIPNLRPSSQHGLSLSRLCVPPVLRYLTGT